jgi:hypothetical protein
MSEDSGPRTDSPGERPRATGAGRDPLLSAVNCKINQKVQNNCKKYPPHRAIPGTNQPTIASKPTYRLAAGSSFTTPLLLVPDEEEIAGGPKHPKRRSAAQPETHPR